MTDIPDDQLVEILKVTKKIAVAVGCEDFNVLQNNGRAAHQEVDHVGPLPLTLGLVKAGIERLGCGGWVRDS